MKTSRLITATIMALIAVSGSLNALTIDQGSTAETQWKLSAPDDHYFINAAGSVSENSSRWFPGSTEVLAYAAPLSLLQKSPPLNWRTIDIDISGSVQSNAGVLGSGVQAGEVATLKEPGALALLGLGVVGLVFIRYRAG